MTADGEAPMTMQTAPSAKREWLGRAWTAVAAIPAFFLITFALGYVLYDLFGYAPENNNAPLWVDLVVALILVAVFLVPCVAAVLFGRRTTRTGDRRGRVPLVLGAVAGLAFTALTVASTIGDAVR